MPAGHEVPQLRLTKGSPLHVSLKAHTRPVGWHPPEIVAIFNMRILPHENLTRAEPMARDPTSSGIEVVATTPCSET